MYNSNNSINFVNVIDMAKSNVIIHRRATPMAIKAGVSKRNSKFKNGGKVSTKTKC